MPAVSSTGTIFADQSFAM